MLWQEQWSVTTFHILPQQSLLSLSSLPSACELVRSGTGFIVPVSQLRSQRTRRICKRSEDRMKAILEPQSPSPVPFPTPLCRGASAQVIRLLVLPALGGPSSTTQSRTLGFRSPWPCVHSFSLRLEGRLKQPQRRRVCSKLKEPIGHPTPEALRAGCTYPLYLCPTHSPRHMSNLSSGSIKTLNSPAFSSPAT